MKKHSDNSIFGKFKSKLTVEAVLNSVMLSLSAGFVVFGIISLISWLCGYKDGIWIALGVGVGVALIAFPLFYFLKFRPTVNSAGQRVDALGLEERAVTMLDFMDDRSYMAERQRLDAKSHISATSAKSLKKTMPMWVMLVFLCAFVFSVPFGVVEALYSGNAISSPIAGVDPMTQYVAVSYFVEDGGEIEGESDQLLLPGESATTVTAVAMDGYMFTGWTDGNLNPSRTDLNITEDLEVTAKFETIDGEGGEGDGADINGPAGGDQANDQPQQSDQGGENGNGEGDGSGAEGNGEGTGSSNGEKGEGLGDGQGEGAGGKWSESNQIIDGTIYYRDFLDQFYADAMHEISSIDDFPPELREFIEAYLESV